MSTTKARARSAGWLFEIGGHRPITRRMLADAGLRWEPLAAVRLRLVRVGAAGQLHLDTACAKPTARCPQLRRAAACGRPLTARDADLLDGDDLCGRCAAELAVPGPEGDYLILVRRILAAGRWVDAMEDTAPSADWLAYSRWTARTPFTDPAQVPALIRALPAGRDWAPCKAAARAAWDRLSARADAAWEQARQAAGPPGYRALAACACSLVAANPATRVESQLITAITALPRSATDTQGPWATASHAWLTAVSLDANPIAARDALLTAFEAAYLDAPVRDVSLLPAMAGNPAAQFCSPAAWAQADYRELLHVTAIAWCQRLEYELTQLLDQTSDPSLLLLVLGWPLTEERDRELAYLACYPEYGRIPDAQCGLACGRDHNSWAVVLHVPSFAALHALTHDGAHLHTIPGPRLPISSQPSLTQVRALLRYARHLDQDPASDPTGPDPQP